MKGSEIVEEIISNIDFLLPNHIQGLKESVRLLLNDKVVVPEGKWLKIKETVIKQCTECKTYNLQDTCKGCNWKELRELMKDG